MANVDDDLLEALTRKFRDELRALGRFNLAVYGKSGAGKSTLINAVFGAEVAATGVGRPVTQDGHLYLHESHAFGLYDTKGLEVGSDGEQMLRDLAERVDATRAKAVEERIHAVWYCVQAPGARIEPAELDFIERVAALGLPVIVVLTKVWRRGAELSPEATQLAAEIRQCEPPIAGGVVHMVLAKSEVFLDQQPHGLQDLLDATFQVVPPAAQRAFVAAQQIDLKAKDRATTEAILAAAAAAAAAAATPFPFASSAILVPIQLALIARIAQIYAVSLDRAAAASFALTAGTTSLGRNLVANLLKFVPGVGSFGGGLINATVATAVTTGLGAAWQAMCVANMKGDIDLSTLPNAELTKMFRANFKPA